MNGFEAIGQARLQAAEGQHQLAAMLARAIGRTLVRFVDRICQHLPGNKVTPW